MTDNVTYLHGETDMDIDPDRVLESAVGVLDRVMVIGMTKDGQEYFASSSGDGPQMLWELEAAKMFLLREGA